MNPHSFTNTPAAQKHKAGQREETALPPSTAAIYARWGDDWFSILKDASQNPKPPTENLS